MKIEQRMKELKLGLIDISKTQGLYVPAIICDSQVITSGQLPFQDQRLAFPGAVGHSVSLENAQRAARIAVVNCLSAIKSVIHDLDKIKKIVRVNGFVKSSVGFTDQPKVMNSASELILDLFG